MCIKLRFCGRRLPYFTALLQMSGQLRQDGRPHAREDIEIADFSPQGT
jgi:hypothetical protein